MDIHAGKDISFDEIQREIEGLKRRFGDNVQISVYSNSAEKSGGGEPIVDDAALEFTFHYKPRELKAYLDRFIIRQDDAKKALAIAICDHYNYVSECEKNPKLKSEDYAKQNVILIGPTGVGKTYLVRTLAKLIGVPFVKADATKFSETGYVGGNVEDLIRDLVTQANGDTRLASYGIVYLDEVDKIASAGDFMGRDVSGRGVQMGLLKLMEETDVDLRTPFDMQAQFISLIESQQKGKPKKQVLNTRHILFIVSGAFNGLTELIQKRLHRSRLGFDATIPSREMELDAFRHVSSQDFVDFGFEPEFIGRLPIHVSCQALGAEDLFNILKFSEGSIIRQYERAFRHYAVEVLFADEGLRELATRAAIENTGARGLMTVLERTLRDYKFELSGGVMDAFVVNAAVIRDPTGELHKLLTQTNYGRRQVALERITRYETDYLNRFSIGLRFDGEARDMLSELVLAQNTTPAELCGRLFSSYEHGLNLIQKTSGRTEFLITREVLADPDGALESWVRESYAPKSAVRAAS